MGVEIVEGNPPPEKMLPIWETLLEQSRFPNPFLTPLWNQLWLKHFGTDLELKTLLLRSSGDEPLGLGVFSNSGEGMEERRIALLGSKDVWDYRDLVLPAGREKEALSLLAAWAAEGPWGELDFSGISEFSPTMGYLPALLRSSGFRVTWEVEEVAVYLALPPTWDDFLAQLNSKDRHELRRKMRRLERELLKSGRAGENWPKNGAFLDLHRKSRKDKAEFMTPGWKPISGRLRTIPGTRLAEPSFLRVEGEMRCVFSFRYGGSNISTIRGTIRSQPVEPGIVLAAHCIGKAIEKG